ncbi:MAG TPA: SDR family oxidoreductase [Candidatus Kapabacteria bacterium]|nr:SDR family oxidoreductase [Candidatus Kapabacteria bacterium]
MTSLTRKKCFITGAASGIGRATAIAAAAQGAELVLTDIDAAGLEAVAAQIRQSGGKVLHSRALDIADYAAVRQYADDLHAQFGSLDVLMNIAGIAIWGTVETLAHAQWRRCIEVNLMGPIHVMECFLPPMIKAGRGGCLVNVASAAGLFPLPMHAPYSASKFGLRGVSEVLRQDLRRHGIHVCLVCPGAVNTGLVQTVQIAGIDLQHPQAVKLRQDFQRHAVTPEQAARAILDGIAARRWMVFTSPDIRFGYWMQRKWAWPFDLAMRWLNNRLHAVVQAAQTRG